MALTVPDESLATLLEANAHHSKRGNDAWGALSDARKEQLLRLAYDYLIGEFASQWPAGAAFGLLADGTVAPGARVANAVLALIAIDGDLDPEVAPQIVESTVGPITDKFAPRTRERRFFPAVERLMSPHLVDLRPANPFSIPLRRG